MPHSFIVFGGCVWDTPHWPASFAPTCLFVVILDVLVPHRPVDVGYRLFPIETKQRHHALLTSGSALSAQAETDPMLLVRNAFKADITRRPGFDAIIFWKPHPEMIVPGAPGRFTKYADPVPAGRLGSNARLQLKGYRVIWGPRLVEPIEPGMYSNGIAPQLDPERTESKVVDSVNYLRIQVLLIYEDIS